MRTIEEQIAENPWRTVVGALALGALVALEAPRASHRKAGRTAADAVLAVVGALALRWVKRVVLHNAGSAANQWFESFKAGKSGAAERPAQWSPKSAGVH